MLTNINNAGWLQENTASLSWQKQQMVHKIDLTHVSRKTMTLKEVTQPTRRHLIANILIFVLTVT